MTSNKEIVEAYMDEAWNKHNLDAIDTYVLPKVVIHSLLGDFRGIEALRNVIHSWLTGFPDLKVFNELVIAEEDLVSIQWSAKGTHRGEFKNKKPTGKRVSFTGVTVYRVENEFITEYWAHIDMEKLLSQINS